MKVRSRRRPRSRRIKFGSIQTQKNEKKAQKHFRIPLKTRKPLRGTGIDFWPRQVQLSEEKKTKISGKKKQLKTHTRTQPNDERQRMSEKKWGKKRETGRGERRHRRRNGEERVIGARHRQRQLRTDAKR